MRLTKKTYYQRTDYMSVSQWKSFRKCEAATMAQLRGEYSPQPSTAMLVGSYVDAYFSKEMDAFKAENPGIFKKDGAPKAEFAQADEIIQRMKSDRLFSLLMAGRKQKIVTGKIGGVRWKGKIDSLLNARQVEKIISEFPDTKEAFPFPDGAIVDQKVMRSLDGSWDGEPFWKEWGYHYQGAVYQYLEGHNLPFVLAVGTKEKPEDLAAVYIDDSTLREALYEVEDSMEHIQAVKKGKVEPVRCEQCPYCRATRKLTTIVNGRSWRR